jgi:multiple sugar transport system substrate-binding protein
MSTTRPRRRVLIGAFALALVASACTFGSSTETAGGDADAGEAVTVTMWAHQSPGINRALRELFSAYEAEHPNVTLELETFDYDTFVQTLQTALPAGSKADIIQMFGTWTCSYADFLASVPEDVSTLQNAQDVFLAAPIGGYTCGDTLYGFPQEFNIEYGATLVNTDIAAAAGVATDGWDSWDEFIADAKKMAVVDGDAMTRAGYHFTAADGLSYSFFSLLTQAGGSILNEDGTEFTLDTPEGKEALDMLKSMVDQGVVDPVLFNDTENWVGDCYFEELCAMGLVGPWVVADYQEDFPDVAAVTTYVPLPAYNGSDAFVADSGWGLTVSKDSPVADTAFDFLSFAALDPENAAAFNLTSGTLPALKENAEAAAAERLTAEFPHFAPFFDILPNGQYVGNLPDRDLVWYDIAYPHLLAALQGNETVEDALAAMQQEANETFG